MLLTMNFQKKKKRSYCSWKNVPCIIDAPVAVPSVLNTPTLHLTVNITHPDTQHLTDSTVL